jgi:O-antigen/teichoic acid export membrane protein
VAEPSLRSSSSGPSRPDSSEGAASTGGGGRGRGRGVLLNLFFSVAGQVVGVAGQLLTVPFFLRAWGDAVYGDWLTLSALSSYLSLTDMGMQLYIINRLTRHEVRGERSEFEETFSSALILYSLFSSLAMVALFGLTFGLPWRHWFAGRAMTGVAIPTTVALLGVSILLSVWCGFFGAMHRSYGRPQKYTALLLGLRVAVLSTTLIVLWSRRGPVFLAASQFFLSFVILFLTVVDLKREHSGLSFRLQRANVRTAVSMVLPSALFAVLSVANGLTNQGTLLVTSSVLGPVAVTAFATSRTLANAVRQVVTLLNNVAWPEFTRLESSGNSQALSEAYRVLVKAGSLFAMWIVSALWFTGPTIYLLWTGGRAKFDLYLFRLFLVDVLLQTPSWASGMLLVSTNRHRPLAMLYVIQGIVAVALCPLAIKLFGVVGVAGVLVGTNFPLFGFLVPAWAQRLLGEGAKAFFLEIYCKMLPILALVATATWMAHRIAPTGLPGAVVATLCTFVPVAVGGAWWLRPSERDLALSLFRRRHGRRSDKSLLTD